jgi:hypothetical protein
MPGHPDRERGPHEGVLRGPSAGLRAWADWIIDVRKRWHEGDPPRGVAGTRLLLGAGAALLAAAALIEKAVGG